MASKPKTFSFHWGNGIVAEEAQVRTEHHVPTFQLLRYTEGSMEGQVTVRFAQYSLRGRFGRGPLIMSADDLVKMRASLRETPELRALLKALVEGD
ncbi:MAG: hypothetical protein IIC29_08065 [Chloroflexi bacterium]|nr:hypothetical protein [Chloroflexota bacterium]MCH8818009.1 hypothetical protein [Chloroflexota bacterium]